MYLTNFYNKYLQNFEKEKHEKESTNHEGHFLDFYRFLGSYAGPKSNLHPRTEISSMASLTPKLSIYCYYFKYFVLTDFFLFKKNTYFARKFIKFQWNLHGSEGTIWKIFEKWMLWVVSFLGVNAFYQFEFYLH